MPTAAMLRRLKGLELTVTTRFKVFYGQRGSAMDTMRKIQDIVDSSRIVLFMKGTPQFPQCGFSSRTVDALKACECEFATVDILADPDIRQHLPRYSQWPTFPQVFIDGEFVGGCDIVLDLYRRGELQKLTAAEPQ